MTASSEQTMQEAGHDGTGDTCWALMTDSSNISKIPGHKFRKISFCLGSTYLD